MPSPTQLVFHMLAFLLILPVELVTGQSVEDKAQVQVQAALLAIEKTDPRPTVFFAPQAGESHDSVVVLARQELLAQGILDYEERGIPGDTIALLGLYGVSEEDGEFDTSASLLFFFDRSMARNGRLHFWKNTHGFRVSWNNDRWSFDDRTRIAHADGWLRLECADTYFAPREEKPEACRGGGL